MGICATSWPSLLSEILRGSSESFPAFVGPLWVRKPRSSVPKCGKVACGGRRVRHLGSKLQPSLIVDQRCICLRTRIGICGRNVCLNPYKIGKGSCSKKQFARIGKGLLQEAAIGIAKKRSPGVIRNAHLKERSFSRSREVRSEGPNREVLKHLT